MFGRRKKPPEAAFDKTGMIPVIRSSICTGEQVAGFKEGSGGKFHELMLIRNDRDLREFLRRYDVNEDEIKKEW